MWTKDEYGNERVELHTLSKNEQKLMASLAIKLGLNVKPYKKNKGYSDTPLFSKEQLKLF